MHVRGQDWYILISDFSTLYNSYIKNIQNITLTSSYKSNKEKHDIGELLKTKMPLIQRSQNETDLIVCHSIVICI